jgi:hypothetical protein
MTKSTSSDRDGKLAVYGLSCNTQIRNGPHRYLSEMYQSRRGSQNQFNSPGNEAEALASAAHCDGLRKCALLPFRNNFTLLIGDIDGARRYCPACIEESPFPDAWGRVLWDIPMVDACPFHALDLMPCSCSFPVRGGRRLAEAVRCMSFVWFGFL